MNVVCNERSLLWKRTVRNGSVMNVVCYERGLLWTWSVMNVICYECGLLWMWSVMSASVMNVVSNERVGFECGL